MKIIERSRGYRHTAPPRQFIRIMKITTLIMLVFLLHVSASTRAQITLDAKSAPLQKVLDDISTQSGYDFVYADNDLKNIKVVNIKLDNASIDKALQACFDGQPLVYEISDKTVMVRRKEDKSVLDRIKDYFTDRDVTGIILDEKGEPLPGATVKVKNGSKVATTDLKGFFIIKNVNEDDILVISFVGYKSKEAPVNSDLTIRLELSSSKLDQVQIEAYGTSSKRTSVNDITTVKGVDFQNQPIDNPLEALQGRVPGLIITPTSGMPGSAIKLQLRGQNSLMGPMTQPLIVVDGVPVLNNTQGFDNIDLNNPNLSSLSFINPDDIESLDFLKDADATSIYGSKGANGVLLITTKKGKAGDTRIDVSSFTGYSQLSKEMPMMNTQQYLQMRRDAYLNDGNPVPTSPNNNFDLTLWDQNRYTDWQKVLLGKNAFFTSSNASISGGNTLLQYVISANYGRQTFIFPGPGNAKHGGGYFSITGASKNEKFRASLSGGYTANSSINPNDVSYVATDLQPNAPAIYNANGTLNWEPGPSGPATWNNPLAPLANENEEHGAWLYSSLELSYKISSSFTLKTTAGITSLTGNSFIGSTIAAKDPFYNAYNRGSSSFFNQTSNSWSVAPQLLYNHAIGEGLLNVIVGASLDNQSQFAQSTSGNGYTNDALLHSLTSASSFAASNNAGQDMAEGVYARATYNWGDKYLLSANVRRDGSSRFGPGHEFGNFVSGGIGWVFSNEEFIKKALPVISFGKIRFTYGTSGNDGIGDYQALGYYQTVGGPPGLFGVTPISYQGIPTLYSTGPNNPDFHWETVTKAELGFELGFFNDRIVLNGNYFRNRSSDQLSSINLPATAGGGTVTANLTAKIQNMGGDLSLNTVNIKTKNFSWSTSGNISFQRNKLLSLPPDFQNNSLSSFLPYGYYRDHNQSPVGHAFSGEIPVYQFLGVNPATGVYMFTGPDGKPTYEGGSEFPAYSALVTINPQYYGGLGNTFRYKNFTLDIFLQFTKQNGLNYLYEDPQAPGTDIGASENTNYPLATVNYWKKPGDITQIQRVSAQGYYTDPNGNYYYINAGYNDVQHSTAAYTDASFIRVKSLSFSYSIPESWKKKLGVRNLTFSINAQNLWTITAYKGWDPETQGNYTLPPLRIITAGFNIGL